MLAPGHPQSVWTRGGGVRSRCVASGLELVRHKLGLLHLQHAIKSLQSLGWEPRIEEEWDGRRQVLSLVHWEGWS